MRCATASTVSTRWTRSIDETIERETIERRGRHPSSSPRARVVGDHARIDSIEVGRSRDRVERLNHRDTYLRDDGGASGDALPRARGSRRERDQSGVQRQGDHDCVCVTTGPSSRPRGQSFIFIHPRPRVAVVEIHGMGQDSSNSPPPCRRNPIHANPSSRGRGGGGVARSMVVYVYV